MTPNAADFVVYGLLSSRFFSQILKPFLFFCFCFYSCTRIFVATARQQQKRQYIFNYVYLSSPAATAVEAVVLAV